MSTRKRPLGSTAFLAGGTVNSADVIPKRTSRAMTWAVLATQAGTFQIFRRDKADTARAISAAEVVTANTELQIHFDFTTQDVFGRYVNTNATPGTVNYIEMEEHT